MGPGSSLRYGRARPGRLAHSSPAPRAHLYFAPSTCDRDLGRVGIGRDAVLVEVLGRLLDLARRRRARRRPACTMPFAFISSTTSTMSFANTIGGVTIVCQ